MIRVIIDCRLRKNCGLFQGHSGMPYGGENEFGLAAEVGSRTKARMAAIIRHPAVAGRFYPSDPNILLSDVHSYLSPGAAPAPALGCMVPHAGYIYSGPVAGAVYAQLKIPQRIIILCPNHTGKGRPLAIMSNGVWETPLGQVPIDTSLGDALKKEFPLLTEDFEAHRSEHAIEVELPFLQVPPSRFHFRPHRPRHRPIRNSRKSWARPLRT